MSDAKPTTTARPYRDLRLRSHADFQLVYKAGRKQFAKEMSFFFRLRAEPLQDGSPGPRVGLTVGKVLGKAHDRNRIKRRLREAVRMHAALLANLDVDVVLHPRRTVLTLEWPKVEAEVAQVFRTVRRLAQKQIATVSTSATEAANTTSPAGATVPASAGARASVIAPSAVDESETSAGPSVAAD